MKKTITTLLAIFLAINLFAAELTTISGVWNRNIAATGIKLGKIECGSIIEIASCRPDTDKKFYFAFAPANEGFYVIYEGPSSANRFTFYFKPGDKLNVEINKSNFKLVGQNTPENEEIAKWQEFVQPLEEKSVYFMTNHSTYVDFFPIFEEKLEAFKSFKTPQTKNSIFNKAFAEKRVLDLNFYAMQLVFTPRSAHPQDEDYPDFFRAISIKELTKTDAILHYPQGISLIEQAGMFKNQFSPTKVPLTPNSVIDAVIAESQNPIVIGEVLLNKIKNIRTYPGFEACMNEYGQYLVTENQKVAAKDIGMELRSKQIEDVKAINFKAQDINGKEVQFSDYLGKVIYIDVWATWCGPCRAEIPALKKITAEYEGKDIIFMSVSTDKVADLEKWRTMVKDEELKGVQLFAGDVSKDILKGYNIAGIPRFILIGKNGKVVQNDAPRPTSPEIRPLLNSILK